MSTAPLPPILGRGDEAGSPATTDRPQRGSVTSLLILSLFILMTNNGDNSGGRGRRRRHVHNALLVLDGTDGPFGGDRAQSTYRKGLRAAGLLFLHPQAPCTMSPTRKRDEIFNCLKTSLDILSNAAKISPVPGLEGIIGTITGIMAVVEVSSINCHLTCDNVLTSVIYIARLIQER